MNINIRPNTIRIETNMRTIETVIDSLTREETALPVEEAFPYRSDMCDLSDFDANTCPWHWHNEVELFYMAGGSLTYHLPGGARDFHPGDVGFINANVLHMTVSDAPCDQREHIFLPRLVGGAPGSAIERNYVLPLTQNPAADLIVIPADDPDAAFIREQLDIAFDAYWQRPMGYEIAIREAMSRVWLRFLARMPDASLGQRSADSDRVKAMLGFIEAHFDQRVTLEAIAASANIGTREASRCFRRQLNMTPFEYLLSFRIERACELLKTTSLPVTDVGLRCGFGSASYFGKLFRQRLHMSPSEYRNLSSVP